MIFLENEHFKIGLLEMGAELRSVIHKKSQNEYIWQADPSVWNRSSPVLFPFVGRLKNDKYDYLGKTYHLPQHGFARNFEFDIISQSDSRIVFQLISNEETLKNYPFQFNLQLIYELNENALELTYRIENTDNEIMYYSIGAHPAFRLNADIDNYSIKFEKAESFDRQLLSAGLRTPQSEKVNLDGNILQLNAEYFKEDAIVIKGMKSNILTILDKDDKPYISLEAENYPYYGIWSKSPFPFVCLEPWDGIADHIESTGLLTEKEGIKTLASSEVVFRRITFRFF